MFYLLHGQCHVAYSGKQVDLGFGTRIFETCPSLLVPKKEWSGRVLNWISIKLKFNGTVVGDGLYGGAMM